MSEKNNLTKKQKYLQYLLPKLDDGQVDKMIAAIMLQEKKQVHNPCNSDTDPYAKLMSMIGCENAKTTLTAIIADYRMRKIAQARGRNHSRAYYHAVFSGNPGCAKTTCARLYAKILANEGITKNGRFAELTRSNIIGQYMGATAPKVREVFQKNAGGVIFIDEAYALCDGDCSGNKSYGEEAINELIVCLENHPETVVIFAGYPDKMKEFLASNPGLCSRIPYRIEFEDYTTEELIDISKVIANDQGFTISDSAIEKLFTIYETAKSQKDFGNGRYVRNVVETAIRTKAILLGVIEDQTMHEYLNSSEEYTDEMLFDLDEKCFEKVTVSPNKEHHRIGF